MKLLLSTMFLLFSLLITTHSQGAPKVQPVSPSKSVDLDQASRRTIVEPPSWYVEMQRNRLVNRKAQSGMKVINLDEKLLKAIRNARLQSMEDILKTAESTLQVVNQIPKSITDLLSKRCQIESQLCRDSYESFRACQGHPMQEIDCVEMFDQLGGGHNCGDLLNCLANETGASDMMDE